MKKIANFLNLKKATEDWMDREVRNPKTGNTVKVKSLPVKEREKYRPKETLHDEAKKGNTDILHHPEVAKIKNEIGNTPLHVLAGKTLNDLDANKILEHQDVAKIKNDDGNTPLHYLANNINPSVLTHPDVAKIKNKDGDTPLHFWAANDDRDADEVSQDILKHPHLKAVKNNKGKTPADILLEGRDRDFMNHPSVAKLRPQRSKLWRGEEDWIHDL